MKRLLELIRSNETVAGILIDYGNLLKRIALVAGLVLIVLAAFVLAGQKEPDIINGMNAETGTEEDAVAGETGAMIYVDIGGAVEIPMLAELPEGSRVEDAIKAAGGLKKDADMSGINRAEFLNDGDKVYIPTMIIDDDGYAVGEAQQLNGISGGKVNINTADSVQLQTLNGVGPATAQKIIDYRTANGRFRAPEDLMNISGIGDKTFEKLKDHITI